MFSTTKFTGGNRSLRSNKVYDDTGRLFERFDMTQSKIKKNKTIDRRLSSRRLKTTDDEFRRAITTSLIPVKEVEKITDQKRIRVYHHAKKLVKEYEKKRSKENWDKKSNVDKADTLMTKAASIKGRYDGLCNGNFQGGEHEHLKRAIEPLRKKGEEALESAFKYINLLNNKEKEEFWKLQERNLNIINFCDLVTKKAYEQKILEARLKTSILENETEPLPETFETEPLPELDPDFIIEPVSEQLLVSEPVSEQLPVSEPVHEP